MTHQSPLDDELETRGQIEGSFPEIEVVQGAIENLVSEARSHFPETVGRSAPPWRAMCAASILRMSDTAQAVARLSESGHAGDGFALIRSLFEQSVTFCWVLIDPKVNFERWVAESLVEARKLHNDLALFDEPYLSEGEYAFAGEAQGMPGVADRCLAIDNYWVGRVDGLHAKEHLLSYRGMYAQIFRLTSRDVHGSLEALLPYLALDNQDNVAAVRMPKERNELAFSLASPVFASALLIGATVFSWIDGPRIRQINDVATGQS